MSSFQQVMSGADESERDRDVQGRDGDRYRARLDALLQSRGVARRIQIDTPLATAVCAFVIAGMGIAVIDRLSAMDNSYRGIIVRPLRPRLAEDLILVTPARHALSRIADAFAGHLRRYCATVLRPANTQRG